MKYEAAGPGRVGDSGEQDVRTDRVECSRREDGRLRAGDERDADAKAQARSAVRTEEPGAAAGRWCGGKEERAGGERGREVGVCWHEVGEVVPRDHEDREMGSEVTRKSVVVALGRGGEVGVDIVETEGGG
jgi:hypothetical protein